MQVDCRKIALLFLVLNLFHCKSRTQDSDVKDAGHKLAGIFQFDQLTPEELSRFCNQNYLVLYVGHADLMGAIVKSPGSKISDQQLAAARKADFEGARSYFDHVSSTKRDLQDALGTNRSHCNKINNPTGGLRFLSVLDGPNYGDSSIETVDFGFSKTDGELNWEPIVSTIKKWKINSGNAKNQSGLIARGGSEQLEVSLGAAEFQLEDIMFGALKLGPIGSPTSTNSIQNPYDQVLMFIKSHGAKMLNTFIPRIHNLNELMGGIEVHMSTVSYIEYLRTKLAKTTGEEERKFIENLLRKVPRLSDAPEFKEAFFATKDIPSVLLDTDGGREYLDAMVKQNSADFFAPMWTAETICANFCNDDSLKSFCQMKKLRCKKQSSQAAQRNSDTQGERSDTQGERSDTQGERSDTQGERSDTQGERSDTQGERSDTQGERSDTQSAGGDRGDVQGLGGYTADELKPRASTEQGPRDQTQSLDFLSTYIADVGPWQQRTQGAKAGLIQRMQGEDRSAVMQQWSQLPNGPEMYRIFNAGVSTSGVFAAIEELRIIRGKSSPTLLMQDSCYSELDPNRKHQTSNGSYETSWYLNDYLPTTFNVSANHDGSNDIVRILSNAPLNIGAVNYRSLSLDVLIGITGSLWANEARQNSLRQAERYQTFLPLADEIKQALDAERPSAEIRSGTDRMTSTIHFCEPAPASTPGQGPQMRCN
jgi:hypothetical protein